MTYTILAPFFNGVKRARYMLEAAERLELEYEKVQRALGR